MGALAGEWHHVVISWDETGASEAHIYLDGVLKNSSASYSAPSISHNNLYFGYVTAQFGGALAEIATFSRMLTAEEAAWAFASCAPMIDTGAHFPPVQEIGPNHGSWMLLGMMKSTTSSTYAAIVESVTGWGGPVSGKLQLETLMWSSNSANTASLKLTWDDAGTPRDVVASEVSHLGTSRVLTRSAIFDLPDTERTYMLYVKSDLNFTVYVEKAILICTPGGLSEL